ncbi:hypothetical protein [Nitrososphaera sp. AFS]|jgi:hypothetical protein|uniref:hypothetical protein n=1 Tax=Nitrososphaera sp. AFS TaxID=2301191 RepID=UPI001F1E77E8|nr:hypothetical protein [Nitrososphaera sp. AFS]
MLIFSVMNNAFAVQFTALLSPKTNSATPDFTAVRFITLTYPAGGPLAKQFNGKSEHVRFTVSGTTGGMDQLYAAFNQAFASQKNSHVQISNATLTYTGDLLGEPTQALVSYKVDIQPTLSNYVLQNTTQGTVLDLNWRSITVTKPTIIDTPKYGKINVNSPIGLFEALDPTLARGLLNSQAASIMQAPLFDFQTLGADMNNWHFLFDPTGSIAGSSGLFSQQPGSRAVSVYALGESSLREGAYTEQVQDASATINGETVGVHASTPPPSAQIQIPGFSKIQQSGSGQVAIVTSQAPAGTTTATGGFPIQVLLVFAGMMGGVAIFVLLKSRTPKAQKAPSRGTKGSNEGATASPRSPGTGSGSPF